MSETINGWAPPVIYDIVAEEKRIATQEDIDRLEAVAQDYGRLCHKLRELGWTRPPGRMGSIPEFSQ